MPSPRPAGPRPWCLLALFAFAAASAAAQSIRATVDRNAIGLGERIVLSVTVLGSQNAVPELPEIPNVDLRPAGSSTQVQFINGQTSVAVGYNYLLIPRAAGTFTIPPIKVELDGKVLRSEPITIKVGAAAPEPERRGDDRDLFVTATVSDKEPYVGEEIVYTWRFFQRLRIADARLEPYDFPGFQVEDLSDGKAREYESIVNGQSYRVHELKKALFPQQAGSLTLTGPSLVCGVVVERRARGGSVFDQMFGRLETEERRFAPPAVVLNVRPLPAAPPGFNGLVGSFGIDAKLSRTALSAGESTTLKVTISGTGNAKLIPEPIFGNLSAFKVYDDQPTTTVEASGDALRGRRVFSKSLVPLAAGTATIPPISLVYFDPAAGAFRTASTAAMPLAVSAASGREDLGLTEAIAPTTGKVAVKVLADDLLPIAKDAEAALGQGGLGGLAALFAFLAPIAAFAGVVAWQQRQRLLAEDRGYLRRQAALKAALGRLREAGAEGPSAEAWNAVRTYIGDKLGLTGSALTTEDAVAALAGRGVAAPLLERVRRTLAELEAAQYGAVMSPGASDAAGLAALLKELDAGIPETKARGRWALVGLALLAALGGLPATAAGTAHERFAAANAAYEAGDYTKAAALYQEIASAGRAGGKLYYNLGNAQLRAGELGRAIASYRRGQDLSPRDPDLAANLAFARRATKDALPPPAPSEVVRILAPWHVRLSRRELASLALLSNLLFWGTLALARLRRSELLHWASLAALAALLATGGSFALRTLAPNATAVVLAQEVEARATDEGTASTRFKLHAGSELEVIESRGGWMRVALPTGEQGWLEAGEVTLVP